MKVVLLHDWLTGLRGGERVLEALCELFPRAPIYTLLHKPGSAGPVIEGHPIHTSWLDQLPGVHENYPKFLPLMPLAASHLQLPPDTQLVISSSHCVIKSAPIPPEAKHLSYIHSPMRYMYDQFDNYFGEASLPIRAAATIARPFLRFYDRNSNQGIDRMVANSAFVRERIRHFYGRDADVLHPFVDAGDFSAVSRTTKGDYFLVVSAFAPNKRIDAAITAFNSLGPAYPLKIIGSGSASETSRLKSMAAPHVEFLGNLSRSEVADHMAGARAFIFPGVEDFGITPLEALAAGTPVIAHAAGGVLETLTPETALFYDQDLASAVRTFEPGLYRTEVLQARSREFTRERFKQGLMKLVEATLAGRRVHG